MIFEGCRFIDNFSANKGGAVGIRGQQSKSTYSDCDFTSNSAGTAGGAVICRFGDGARFERCVFRENETSVESGAVHIGGDSFPLPATFLQCDFIDNFSSFYAGAAIFGGTRFQSCRFIRNVCGGTTTGGAVQVHEDATFDGCLFDGNDSWGPGGAMMVLPGATATLTNCTLTSNITLETGGAINGNAMLRNCVLWNNSPDELSGAFDVAYSNVPGGWPGIGNMDVKPRFHNPVGADRVAGNEDDDLRLTPGSPCADAGDNSAICIDVFDLDGDGDTAEQVPFDLFGNSRVADDPVATDTGNPAHRRGIVDLGPFETPLHPPPN